MLVVDDCLPHGKWNVGRVTNDFSGAENLVRLAVIKTGSGKVHPPVAKTCLRESSE